MQTIEYKDALRALNHAVADKGYGHAYERQGGGYCYNVWEGQPACIVGHALIFLGVPIEWFGKDTRDNDAVADVCHVLFMEGMFKITDEALHLLSMAQVYQDGGLTWGVAVTRAHLGQDWFDSLNLHVNAA